MNRFNRLQKPILKHLGIGSIFCTALAKDKKYYILSDIASWSKCGHIKTILPYEVIFDSDIEKIKKLKKLITLKNNEQIIVKFGKHHAIYNVKIRSYYNNENKIRSTSFTKIPNLNQCRCGG